MTNLTSTRKLIGFSFATQYVELAIHFLGVLALARILPPEEIGIYSIAAFLMAMLHMLRDFGVVQYLIQEHELSTEKIRSAMGVSIILALSAAFLMFACSSVIARFYGNPGIKNILLVMSISFAISPFGSLLFGIFRREMKFQTIFYIKTVSAICHVAVALSLAISGYGAISLAWANFAGILSFGIVANIMRPPNIPWMPRFSNIRTILSFGSIASLGNAANTAGTNIHEMVIGKAMDMASVGYFSRATGLVQLFTRLITSAVLPLVLPYFSQLRREGKDLAAPYLVAVELLTALAWPFFASLMLLAAPVVRALYGPQWDISIPIVELLCLAGAISSISLFAAQVMVANGQVGKSTYAQLLAQPFRIAAIFFTAIYGLKPIAIALIVSECFTLVIISWFLHKTIKVGPWELACACKKSAFITLCSSVIPLLIKIFWEDDPSRPWLPLLIGIAGAAIGWLSSILWTRHALAAHLVAVFRSAQAALFARIFKYHKPSDLKAYIKTLAYHWGLLGIYHRFRNRNSLTVAMFHRVLPATDPRHAGADPEWTITPESFSHCLKFFREHYQIVSPNQVFSALRGESKLPRRSLLVTFDDGWADTAEYAQPILDEFSIPALIFVAADAINRQEPFWEEHIYSLLATHPKGISQLQAVLDKFGITLSAISSDEATEKNIRAIIQQLGRIDRPTLMAVIKSLNETNCTHAAMLNTDQLACLASSCHTIGGHGMTHQPLTRIQDPEAELKNARDMISAYLVNQRVDAMSFPHGAYSEYVIEKSRLAGYRYLFSSDAHLNALVNGEAVNKPVGRIHISERAITDSAGRFQSELLATWLFLRPVSYLG